MRSICFIFCFVSLLLGCMSCSQSSISSRPNTPSPSVDLEKLLSQRQANRISQDVSGNPEALALLRRKQSYYKALFQQSFDPYYGTPKFSEECLQENSISEIVTTDRGAFLAMTLVLSPTGDAGYCSKSDIAGITRSHMVYLVCGSETRVQRLIMKAEEAALSLPWADLCP